MQSVNDYVSNQPAGFSDIRCPAFRAHSVCYRRTLPHSTHPLQTTAKAMYDQSRQSVLESSEHRIWKWLPADSAAASFACCLPVSHADVFAHSALLHILFCGIPASHLHNLGPNLLKKAPVMLHQKHRRTISPNQLRQLHPGKNINII